MTTPPTGATQEQIDAAVKILREDAQATRDKAILERLDKLEANTRKTPQTPEEKAQAWDEYQASLKNKPPEAPRPSGAPEPPPAPPGPVPPPPAPPKDPPPVKRDPWFGDQT